MDMYYKYSCCSQMIRKQPGISCKVYFTRLFAEMLKTLVSATTASVLVSDSNSGNRKANVGLETMVGRLVGA